MASLSGLKNLSNFFDFLFLSLVARIEYILSLNSTDLRLFNANDSAARRAIGAHSIACFQADHRRESTVGERIVVSRGERDFVFLCLVRRHLLSAVRIRCNVRSSNFAETSSPLL